MEDFTGIINWENVFKNSEIFKNNPNFRFGFIEDFFVKDFYKKLYQTYPKIDETWIDGSDHSKSQLTKFWGKFGPKDVVEEGDDPSQSKEWNKFKKYAMTDEFINNFRKFSGVEVTKLKHFKFMSYQKGGFQLPHIHDVGPSTLVMMLYFSKDWSQGDPGGTYMSTELDESTIIFEPYNLDNSLALFQDGPNAAHGVRYIVKDVERRALQITLEGYSKETGWTGDPKELNLTEV
jgi:hypothetical protein